MLLLSVITGGDVGLLGWTEQHRQTEGGLYGCCCCLWLRVEVMSRRLPGGLSS